MASLRQKPGATGHMRGRTGPDPRYPTRMLTGFSSTPAQVKVGFEAIIKRHLELLGYNEVEAQSIRIELQPIDTPVADLQVLLNIAAMDPKALSMGQAIEMAGLHIPPRQTVDFEEDQTIQSDDQTPPAVAMPPGKGASVTMFGAKINVLPGELIQAAFKRKTKQELSATVEKWKSENKKIPLPASKAGEWRLIFGRYINVKEGEDEGECYLKQTRRNYDDDSEAWSRIPAGERREAEGWEEMIQNPCIFADGAW